MGGRSSGHDNSGVLERDSPTIFYEETIGLIYKPKPSASGFAPEAALRLRRTVHPSCHNDGTRNSQLTLAVDAILLY